MPVKGNHRILHKKIACHFQSPELYQAEFGTAQETCLHRGRIEVRRLTTSDALPARFTSFAGVKQVYRIERQVIVKRTGAVRDEVAYGITSLSAEQATPARLLRLIRGHWTIENRSHYVRDVTYREDVCRVRSGGAGQVLAALRNACIGLIRLAGHRNVATACRYFAARPQQALRTLGIPITE
jgi:predicted transposase YbfD/YdcC